jgi:alcohol dehydrogenase class IV
MNFEFATATRILFGPGLLSGIGPLAAAMGRRALIVTGRSSEAAESLARMLEEQAIVSVRFPVLAEPTVEVIRAGVEWATAHACDLVIGFGGGSAIDAGKAIAALRTNSGDLLEYLEVIGEGRPLIAPPLPFIAIPTTAGTGSEVTRNAVIASPEHQVKVSLRSPLMLPRLALVDPELTLSLPADVTASTGLDALTQLIEPFTCNAPNPLVDAVCREGISRAARSLRKACEKGSDPGAREDMSFASLCGGLALANARLGAVHGIAGPLGGMFPAPHGAVCAALLPHVMATNIRALKSRAPENPVLLRYQEIARIVTGTLAAQAEEGVAWIGDLCRQLHIPPLSAWGVGPADLPDLIAKSAQASSMKGNPLPLTRDEMQEIVEKAL